MEYLIAAKEYSHAFIKFRLVLFQADTEMILKGSGEFNPVSDIIEKV